MTRYYLLALFLLFSGFSHSKDIFIYGGGYYDSVTNLTSRLGVMYALDRVEEEQEYDGEKYTLFRHSNIIFFDLAESNNGKGIAVGWGRIISEGNYRLGVRYFEEENIRYRGVEGSITAFYYNFKLGVYARSGAKPRVTFGVGLELW